jgi:hypothetical protein
VPGDRFNRFSAIPDSVCQRANGRTGPAIHKIIKFMRHFLSLTVVNLMLNVLHLQIPAAEAASPRDTADYPIDPRPIVAQFFRYVRAGEAEAAWKCWKSEVRQGADKKYEETQVRNTIAQWIANFRLEQALQEKVPQLYENMKADGTLTPTPEQIAKAKCTTFRRLAIIRWSDDEDAGLPLELDTTAKPPTWLISLGHYRETTRASVGDSFRATNITAKATDAVTKDVLDGKVRTAEDLAEAQLRHLDEQLKKLPKPKE